MIAQNEQLPANIIKNLFEKNSEKREAAGQQLQIIIAKSIQGRNIVHVQRIINEFGEKYIGSQNAHHKRCGLETLTWIAQGLKDYPDEADRLVQSVIRPVLSCFNDTDQKTKYTAIKSLYYICKFLEQVTVKVFNIIFENVLLRVSDPDDQIRNAAELLNGTLKTIISDALSDNIPFELPRFMSIITQHLKDTSHNTREFLIDWINTIDEVPSIDLSVYLPCFLEDVLFMLGDKEKELRSKAQECLKAFLFDLKQKFYSGKLQNNISEQNLSDIITILVDVCKGKSSAYSKLTAIVWLEELFSFFRQQVQHKTKIRHKYLLKKVILERFDQILQPILGLLSYEQEQVQKAAMAVNEQLLQITQILKKQQIIDFNNVMPLLKNMLCEKKSSTTSDSVLTWMKFLLENYNDKILPQINDIIQKLVEELCDGSTKNVMGIIENVSLNEQYFDLVIAKLLSLLFQNKAIEFRTEEILRKFCEILDPQKTYVSICLQILSYEDAKFIEATVDSMNILLVTEKTLMPLRRKLRNIDQPSTRQLFEVIYKSFSYNTVAVITLCYLAEQYSLAYQVIISISRQPVSSHIITNLCKFVNLFESPSFVSVRLQMLQRARYPYLVESIYSLMMLIPQGKVFSILKNRVDTVNHIKHSIKCKEPRKVYRLNNEDLLKMYYTTRQLIE